MRKRGIIALLAMIIGFAPLNVSAENDTMYLNNYFEAYLEEISDTGVEQGTKIELPPNTTVMFGDTPVDTSSGWLVFDKPGNYQILVDGKVSYLVISEGNEEDDEPEETTIFEGDKIITQTSNSTQTVVYAYDDSSATGGDAEEDTDESEIDNENEIKPDSSKKGQLYQSLYPISTTKSSSGINSIKCTSKKNKYILRWNAIKNAKGYMLKVSANKNMRSYKRYIVKKNKLSIKKKNISVKKNIFVRIKVINEKYNGKWSKVRKITI